MEIKNRMKFSVAMTLMVVLADSSTTTTGSSSSMSTETSSGTNSTEATTSTTESNNSETTSDSNTTTMTHTFTTPNSTPSTMNTVSTTLLVLNTSSDVDSADSVNIIIIVAAAAVSGVVVGIMATIVVVCVCRRNKHQGKTSKSLSIKRNLSYTVTKESEEVTKATPVYIQILPDLVGSSDDSDDFKHKPVGSDSVRSVTNTDELNTVEDEYDIVPEDIRSDIESQSHQKFSNLNGGVNLQNSGIVFNAKTDKVKIEDDDYAVVADAIKPAIVQIQKDHNYSDAAESMSKPSLNEEKLIHCKLEDRQISCSGYSHINLNDRKLRKHDEGKFAGTEDVSNGVHNSDDGFHSNLDAKIEIALQDMDKTIANYEYDNSGIPVNKTEDDTDSEYDDGETYDHLGNLEMKNDFGQSKLNYGQYQKRNRSRSLPAEDLKPQVKAICDEIDVYDHLNNDTNDNEHTYYNWLPSRRAKTKSLPESQNLEYTKGIREQNDNYSHINLSGNANTPKRKHAVAAPHPSYLNLDSVSSQTPPNNGTEDDNYNHTDLGGYDLTSINRIKKQKRCDQTPKQTEFTLQENPSSDDSHHSYFILEPVTTPL